MKQSLIRVGLYFICIITLGFIYSCSSKNNELNSSLTEKVESVSRTVEENTSIPQESFTNYVEKGDVDQLRARGVLRLISPRWEESGLPRAGLPSSEYRKAAEIFAKRLNLKPQWIYVNSLSDLLPTLNTGAGDVIVSHLTQTKSRAEHVAFSLPLAQSEDVVVSLLSQPVIELLKDFSGKRFVVPKGSSFIESLQNVKATSNDISFEIIEAENVTDPEVLIDKLVNGEADATVLDSDVVQELLTYRTDIVQGMAITGKQPIAWAVRKNSPQLLSSLNQYLTETRIKEAKNKTFTSDLNGIKKRQILRVITRNNPVSYFLWRGELMGFEYELVKKFAEDNKLRLEAVVVPPEEDLIDWLLKGKGDLIASAMTISEERRAKGIEFTRYYNKVNEQFVTNNQTKPINSLDDLVGRTLVIKKQHSYWKTAKALQESGVKFEVVEAPESETSTDILNKIHMGEYDATIVDSHLLAIESKFLSDLSPGLKLDPAREHGWAVRAENIQLLGALNQFIKKYYKGLYFNVTYNKYYKNTKRIDKYQGERLSAGENLSPYDNIVQPVAKKNQFDWRLVVSQMYQESRFNPNAKSFAGALGLMQVMPRTAKELGYSLPLTTENGIHAGVQYLDWTRDRFEVYLPIEERLWFSLAAYNAGFGHIRDARRLATQKGWDSDKWFGNVERAVLLLSKKEYYKHARFGYVRGKEPVNYVRQIRDRYNAYLALPSK